MNIVRLADRPDLAAILSDWHFAEWASLYPDWSLEICRRELEAQRNPDQLPTTLVALDEHGSPVGSVSLLLNDLPGYEEYSPWLASLYVRPHRRGVGLGGSLLAAALSEARRLGVQRLYLFTPAHATYYSRRGWEELGQAATGGVQVSLMTRCV